MRDATLCVQQERTAGLGTLPSAQCTEPDAMSLEVISPLGPGPTLVSSRLRWASAGDPRATPPAPGDSPHDSEQETLTREWGAGSLALRCCTGGATEAAGNRCCANTPGRRIGHMGTSRRIGESVRNNRKLVGNESVTRASGEGNSVSKTMLGWLTAPCSRSSMGHSPQCM